MARVVVVATSSVDRSILAGHLEVDDELFVVVPAVEQSRLAWLTNDESDARERGACGRRVHRRRRTTARACRRRQARRTEPGRSRRDRRASSRSDHRRNPGRRRRDMARGRRARPSTRPDRRRAGNAHRYLIPRAEAGQARRVIRSLCVRCRRLPQLPFARGLVAQGIEHRFPKPGVGGSSPPGAIPTRLTTRIPHD